MNHNIQITKEIFLSENAWTLVAFINGKKAGHLHICRSEDVAEIADIVVSEYKTYRFNLLPVFKKTVSFRNQGVGTALLKEAIELCRKSHIKVIKGNIVGDTDRLIKWYRKNNFEVNDNLEINLTL